MFKKTLILCIIFFKTFHVSNMFFLFSTSLTFQVYTIPCMFFLNKRNGVLLSLLGVPSCNKHCSFSWSNLLQLRRVLLYTFCVKVVSRSTPFSWQRGKDYRYSYQILILFCFFSICILFLYDMKQIIPFFC